MSAIIGSLRADLSMRSVAFNKGVDEATRKLNGLSKNFKRVGRQLQGIGKSLTLGLTAPITAFGALTLKSSGDFQAAMNKVGAVSGATASELDALREVAKKMGASTQYSASQSAQALSFLAMAGLDARETIGALPGTLQLAASAQMDLGDAADIVSNVLSGYGMEVSELARVNDVLVKTFTSSNTDLRQLGEAMKYAGPIASAAGVSFEEAAASIGLMGNAGIQASMAGTSLRGAIGRILDPTNAARTAMKNLSLSFTDSAGKLISFDKIVAQLAPHADDAGLFIKLFGQRAGPAMAALVSQGSDALVKLRGELENAGGTAARIAAAQMEGFNGAMKRLASAFEAVQIAIGDSGLLEFATRMAEGFAVLLTQLSEVNPKLLGLGTIIAGVVLALGPLVLAAGLLSTAFAAIAPVVLALAVPVAALATVAAVVVSAWEPLVQAVQFLRNHILLLSPLIGQLVIALSSTLVAALASAASGMIGLAVAIGTRLVGALRLATVGLRTFKGVLISTGVGAAVVLLGTLVQKFVELVDKAGSFGGALTVLKIRALEVWDRIGNVVKAAGYRIAASAASIKADILEALGAIVNKLPNFVNPIIGAYVGAFHALKAIWTQLPQVMGNVAAGAANFVLSGMEKMINLARVALWKFVDGAARLLSEIPGVDIKVQPLDKIELKRVETQATSVGASVKDAFGEAFSRDYTGDMASGLESLSGAARKTSKEFGDMADSYSDAASKPLQSLEALAAAQRELSKTVEGSGEALAGTTKESERLKEEVARLKEKIKQLEEALAKAGQAGNTMGDGVSAGADKAARALDKAAKKAKSLQDDMRGIFKGFTKDLVSGDIKGGFSNMFKKIKGKATDEFSDLVFGEFSKGGKGFGGIWSGLKTSMAGIKTSWAGIKTGFSAIFGGAGTGSAMAGLTGVLGGIGSAVSAALPIIGAVIAGISLIKGFSSKKVIGGGLKLGIEHGRIAGGSYKRIQKSKFWGLSKKQYDQDAGFNSENAKALQAQADAVQGAVKSIYGSLGITAADTALKAVSLTIKRIDTKGLNEKQIKEKIGDIFTDYGNALSGAIAGIGLDLATNLAQVQAMLAPLGKAFDIFGAKSATFSRQLLQASATAALALSDIAGGAEALGKKTSAFYGRFFSDVEKLENIQNTVNATFAKLGLSVPTTDAAFRKLTLGQNLMSEAGRKAYNTLLDIAPQFGVLSAAAQSVVAAAAEAARIEKQALADLRTDRENTVFDLLPEESQLQILRKRIHDTFAEVGANIPKTLNGLATYLKGLNLATIAGASAYEAIKAIIPAFEKLQDAAQVQRDAALEAADAFKAAVADMRGEYALDASRYATAFEAKLAHELGNQDAYSQEVINAQNVELKRQSALLDKVVGLLSKQNKLGSDTLLLAGMT